MSVAWAVAFALLYRARTGYARGAAVCGALVLSHWVLDFATHVPDLPIVPGGSARVGLGLWTSVSATIAVEMAMYAAGLFVYARATRPLDRAGSAGFWSFAALLVLLYLASLAGAPPSSTAVALATLLGWAFVPWIAWFDRHRVPRASERSTPL
jgi:hypothetical protein